MRKEAVQTFLVPAQHQMELLQALQASCWGESHRSLCIFLCCACSTVQQCLCSWDEGLLSCPVEGIWWECVLFFCRSGSLGNCLPPCVLFISRFPLYSSAQPVWTMTVCSSLDFGSRLASRQADILCLVWLLPIPEGREGKEQEEYMNTCPRDRSPLSHHLTWCLIDCSFS